AAPLRIAHRRDDAERFMQNDIRVLCRQRNDLAGDRDLIALFNARPKLANDLSVHANLAAHDELFRRAPRRDAGMRQVFLQPHCHTIYFSGFSRTVRTACPEVSDFLELDMMSTSKLCYLKKAA